MKLIDYINALIAQGKVCFTLDEAVATLNKSRKAIIASIAHLTIKKELVSPADGFYIIVPAEYRTLGSIPVEQFIPYLMKYWNCNYYAALLTASRYNGASHQAPLVFQVMIDKRRSSNILKCGKINIQFIVNRHLSVTPIQKIMTAKSVLNVSTPEGTAMDLLMHPKQSGGINHILTVLSELIETMNAKRLRLLAEQSIQIAWKQRLGYLLEKLNAKELAKILKKNIDKQQRVDYIPIMSGMKKESNVSKNKVWKIIENVSIEGDI